MRVILDLMSNAREISFPRAGTGRRAHERVRYAAAARAARVSGAELRKELHGGGAVRGDVRRAPARTDPRPEHALPACLQARCGRGRQALFPATRGERFATSSSAAARTANTCTSSARSAAASSTWTARSLQAYLRRGARQQRVHPRSKGNRSPLASARTAAIGQPANRRPKQRKNRKKTVLFGVCKGCREQAAGEPTAEEVK